MRSSRTATREEPLPTTRENRCAAIRPSTADKKQKQMLKNAHLTNPKRSGLGFHLWAPSCRLGVAFFSLNSTWTYLILYPLCWEMKVLMWFWLACIKLRIREGNRTMTSKQNRNTVPGCWSVLSGDSKDEEVIYSPWRYGEDSLPSLVDWVFWVVGFSGDYKDIGLWEHMMQLRRLKCCELGHWAGNEYLRWVKNGKADEDRQYLPHLENVTLFCVDNFKTYTFIFSL